MTEARVSAEPTLSVIVPVYNSRRELEQCLDGLASSRYEGFEVWVVDDGSTESIEPVVESRGFHYVKIDGPRGPARARNRGALKAAAEILVFVDADVMVDQDTLARFAEVFAEEPDVAAVIGSYDDAPAAPGFLSQYKNLFHHYVHQDSHGPVPTFWSGCGAMRREVFLRAGGFDDTRYRRPAIEDIELGTRLTLTGHRIVLDRRIHCRHLKRWTLASLLKSDIFDRGIPWTRLMLRAGSVENTLNVQGHQRVSVVLVYAASILAVTGVWVPHAWLAAAALALIVMAVNLSFYSFFASRRGWWFALRVVPLHWLYFLYCGLSVVVGVLLHGLSGDERGLTHRAPLTDSGES